MQATAFPSLLWLARRTDRCTQDTVTSRRHYSVRFQSVPTLRMRPSLPSSSVAAVAVVLVAEQTAARLARFSLDLGLICLAESMRLWWPNFLLLLSPLSFACPRYSPLLSLTSNAHYPLLDRARSTNNPSYATLLITLTQPHHTIRKH